MSDLINRGLRALDYVKHCEDMMTPEMQEHDKLMRNTAPNQWTEEQVMKCEATNNHVNG